MVPNTHYEVNVSSMCVCVCDLHSTGGVAPGTITAPLLGTATKYNFSLGRSIKLPFSPLKSPASLRSATASPSISSPVVVTTPSSLLRRSLHAPVVMSGLGSDGTEDASGLVSTDSSATPHSTVSVSESGLVPLLIPQ